MWLIAVSIAQLWLGAVPDSGQLLRPDCPHLYTANSSHMNFQAPADNKCKRLATHNNVFFHSYQTFFGRECIMYVTIVLMICLYIFSITATAGVHARYFYYCLEILKTKTFLSIRYTFSCLIPINRRRPTHWVGRRRWRPKNLQWQRWCRPPQQGLSIGWSYVPTAARSAVLFSTSASAGRHPGGRGVVWRLAASGCTCGITKIRQWYMLKMHQSISWNKLVYTGTTYLQ